MDKLYEKYIITKRDGSPIDPEAQYFVLRLDSDHCARLAARRYADCIEPNGPGLAKALRALVNRLWLKSKSPVDPIAATEQP